METGKLIMVVVSTVILVIAIYLNYKTKPKGKHSH